MAVYGENGYGGNGGALDIIYEEILYFSSLPHPIEGKPTHKIPLNDKNTTRYEFEFEGFAPYQQSLINPPKAKIIFELKNGTYDIVDGSVSGLTEGLFVGVSYGYVNFINSYKIGNKTYFKTVWTESASVAVSNVMEQEWEFYIIPDSTALFGIRVFFTKKEPR